MTGASPRAPVVSGEFEQFLELRQHVKKMQAGTPLLLRTEASGSEELQICTFWVSEDLRVIKWRENEGGPMQEVPLDEVTDVIAESENGNIDLHESSSLAGTDYISMTIKQKAAEPMELICATSEDFSVWHQGLRFLCGIGDPAEHREVPRAPAAEQAEGEVARLQRENDLLKESLRRKDATIAELMRDLQGRPGRDHYNKTVSSSRESDEHLRDRESTVLRHKNRKLARRVKTQQATIVQLSELLKRCTEWRDGEDRPESAGYAECQSADVESWSEAAPDVQAAMPDLQEGSGDGDEDAGAVEEMKQEVLALAGQLEALERAVGSGLLGLGPDARDVRGAPPGEIRDPGGGCRGGASRLGEAATAALSRVTAEMRVLEEKKRVVEQLAKTLEPDCDNEEEHDEFPLM